MDSYSYEQTIIPVRARRRISVVDSGYAYKAGRVRVREKGTQGSCLMSDFKQFRRVAQGAFVVSLALIVSLGTSGSVFLASAIEPDIVEGHVVNVVAKIEPAPTPEPEEQVVLNEILPNPEGSDSQDGLLGEWVELYNNGSSTVDVAGWYIKDGSASGNTQIITMLNTHTDDTVIGPKGSGSEWLVVFMNASILNNTGDTVSLFDSEDLLRDSHTFGDSDTDEDTDSNTSAGGDNGASSGTETAGNEGKSFARIPDGTGAWVDPVPTPGGPNKLEEVAVEPPTPDLPADEAGASASQGEPAVEEVPVTTGGGGSVGSVAGSESVPAETPAETPEPAESPEDIQAGPPPATTSPDVGGGGETPAETSTETPAEDPMTAGDPVETPAADEPAVTEPSSSEASASQEEPAVAEETPIASEEPAVVPEETLAAVEEAAIPPPGGPDSTETPA